MEEGGLGALLVFRATTTDHRGEAVLPEFEVEEEVVSGVGVEGAEVVSSVDAEGAEVVSSVDAEGAEVVSSVDAEGAEVVSGVDVEGAEVVSSVDAEGAEVVSSVEEGGNGAVSGVEEGGSEAVTVAEVVRRHGVGAVVEDDKADLDVSNKVGALREVEVGGRVDEDLCVEIFRACGAFVGGCTAGDNDDTRVDISLQSVDTESARDCK